MSAADHAAGEVDRRIAELRHTLEAHPFAFDRRFLFRALAMGHSQFAELIGARGPNTQVNSACASTAVALSVAEDWIRAGRCRRVIVVSADDVASDTLLPWTGSGFLASGAAATDDVVEDAALPFDRRRHGMIIGSGAAALVVESAAAARERGIRPICEVLAAVAANSAFHGTRLDVDHIGQVMEQLIRQAERRGIDRLAIAGQTVFVSHETYTPARGGSASAEISAFTRSWFHTGAYLGREAISRQFEREYFDDPGLTPLDDTILPGGLTLDEEREACRALKGSMLRQEVYADDRRPERQRAEIRRARTPYTVTEQNFTIRAVQPRGGNRHAVFFTHAREAITDHYERSPADPRIQHALTLAVDAYGNVLEQAAIGYGRRRPDASLPSGRATAAAGARRTSRVPRTPSPTRSRVARSLPLAAARRVADLRVAQAAAGKGRRWRGRALSASTIW